MANFSYDRLCGSDSLQTTHEGIQANLQLPSNIITGASTINGVPNDDYVDFYLIFNDFIEGGVSWNNGGFRIFLNTGAFYGGDALYWRSTKVSELGLNIGFGSNIKLKLVLSQNGTYSQLYVGTNKIYELPNYQTQPLKARVSYTHGCKDQFGYVQHNTATWSNVQFLRSGAWVNWDATNWGYAPNRKNSSPYGVYTEHPLSAYLAKPNGPSPVIP